MYNRSGVIFVWEDKSLIYNRSSVIFVWEDKSLITQI